MIVEYISQPEVGEDFWPPDLDIVLALRGHVAPAAKHVDDFVLGFPHQRGILTAHDNDALLDLGIELRKSTIGNDHKLVHAGSAKQALVRLENPNHLEGQAVDANFTVDGIERAKQRIGNGRAQEAQTFSVQVFLRSEEAALLDLIDRQNIHQVGLAAANEGVIDAAVLEADLI